LGRAVDLGTDALDVGVEATLRDLARPRPVVAEARLLGADVADGSHEVLLNESMVLRTGARGRATAQEYRTTGLRRKSASVPLACGTHLPADGRRTTTILPRSLASEDGDGHSAAHSGHGRG